MEKLYYKIGEVEQLLGLKDSTLRYWEKEFPALHPTRRLGKGNRLYTKEDIELLKQIKALVKDKGLKLDAAKRQLRNKKSTDYEIELLGRLRKIHETLVQINKQPADSSADDTKSSGGAPNERNIAVKKTNPDKDSSNPSHVTAPVEQMLF